MPSMAATRSSSNGSEGTPARKRLKLNVRKPSSTDSDTIAVLPRSRPKRASAGRSRYSEEVIESDDEIEHVKAKSPATSSGLSSPISETASVKDEVPTQDAKIGGRASYGDSFMNYYITGGGDDDEEDAAPAPALAPKSKPESVKPKPAAREKQPRKPRAKKTPAAPAPVSSVTSRRKSTDQSSSMLPPRPTTRQGASTGHGNASKPNPVPPQAHPSARPSAVSRPPPAIPVSMPTQMQPVQTPILEPPVLEEITVKYHASVPEKIKKLQALSAALTNFGGVPAASNMPPSADESKKAKKPEKAAEKKNKKEPNKQAKQDGAPLDKFLDLFDSDDSSDEQDGDEQDGPNSETDDPVEKSRFLEHTGEPDGPLTYGIQFIMNALKSWAQARIQQQHLAAIRQGQMPPPAAPNAPPSTTRSFVPRRPSLSDTPEGKAIAAFREVVESGCLQVNVVMPADLAAAVRHLYVQIDQLINQGSKAPPEPWQPMSYSAQIKAHQMRVERWKDQEARAQQAVGHHQQPPPGFYQMPPGMPHIPNGHFHQPQHPQQMHDASDRRRSTPHDPNQLHARQPPRSSLPAGINGLSPSPMNGPFAGPPSNPQGGFPGPAHPQGANGDMTLEEKAGLMQTGNYRLPRSGQTMTFSFAPENPAALQAFGPAAFPAMNQPHTSNIPNRGPMPPLKPTPMAPGDERPVSRSEHDKIKSEHDVRSPSGNGEPHVHPARSSLKPSGFTAVNAPVKPAHDSATSSTPEAKSPGLSRSDAVVLDD